MKKTISLPPEYNEMLEREKKRTGAPMSEIVRRALRYYFKYAIQDAVDYSELLDKDRNA